MNRKNADIIFLVLILTVLFIPVLTMNLLPRQVSMTENRSLAERPSLSEGITTFMCGTDKYVEDRIGLRDEMVRLYNELNYDLLKGNHSNVVVGDDGWLFYKKEEELLDYTGTNVSIEKTAQQVQILEAIDEWCDERGIIFIFSVGPNKSTIYDQYMPDYIYHAPVTNLDNLLAELGKTDINFFCPKDELIAHRDDQELYLRQDTHWNCYGSRYLLDAMVAELGFPAHSFPVSEDFKSQGDLLTMLATGENEYSSLYTTVPYKEGAYTENLSGSDLMLFSPDTESFICYRDSFTKAMLPYYSYYFHGPLYWDFKIDFDYVEAEKPQYLVLSCVERYVDRAIYTNYNVLAY